jgi:hypothetical protein
MLNPRDKASIMEAIQKLWHFVEMADTSKECFDCISFKNGQCEYWQQKIPEDALKDGCEKWEFKGSVPF